MPANKTTPDTGQFAVIGDPVEHSKSPLIHSMFGRQLGIPLVYERLPAKKENFSATVREFFAADGKGLNVTVPFKGNAFELCDTVSQNATVAHAVNTIALRDQKLAGFNTDGIGLVQDIIENLGQGISGYRILLLGAGGAVRGVLGPLQKEGPSSVTLANRTRQRAEEMVRQVSPGLSTKVLGYEDLAGKHFDIIINGTSSGLNGDTLPLPEGVFEQAFLAYDMMYGPAANLFTGAARAGGATRVTDGLGMLVEQAAESFAIWHGTRPQTDTIISHLRGEV